MKEVMECTVVEVNNEMAKVKAKMHSDCSNCGLCEGNNSVYYEAINKVNAKCGQNVLLEVDKQSVLKIAFMVFIAPLVIIAVASALGVNAAIYLHISKLVAAIILSFIGLIPTLKFIKKYDNKIQDKSSTPVITKILDK